MKAILIQSKKKSWTNRACREALGVAVDEGVSITKGNVTLTRSFRPAPSSACRVMRAFHANTGLYSIAVTRDTLHSLGARVGDTVELVSNRERLPEIQQGNTPSSTPKSASNAGKAQTLGERIKAAKKGDILEVTESAAKSSAYSAASKVGRKVKRVGTCQIEVL